MSAYEVLTRLSNGKKNAHAIGSVVELEPDAAAGLVAIGALRPVASITRASNVEADGEPIGTAQRAMAAATSGDDKPDFLTATAQMRTDLGRLTVKKLDALGAAEQVEFAADADKATKVEALLAGRNTRHLAGFDRGALLDLAAASGYADVTAFDLAEDAADDEIRAALMRVAAAKAS